METPAGTPAIGEHTQVRGTLGRMIAVGAFLCVGSASVGIGYARLSGRIDKADAALEAHRGDQSVHLEPMYHMGHGRPVGNFDFTQVTGRIEAKLDKVQEKQNTVVCRPRSGGVLVCEPKEAP